MIKSRHGQRGLTLVELMIAVTLGLLVSAALAALYLNSARSFREDNEFARILENGRFAMRFFADDLQMADFWGEMLTPQDIADGGPTPISAATVNCGAQPLRATTAETAFVRAAVATFNCLPDDNAATPDVDEAPKAGSQALMIKRVSGSSTDEADLEEDTVYLSTNRTTGTLVYDSDGVPGADSCNDICWQYMTTIYYLNESDQFCRARLGLGTAGNAFGTECLVDGVEDIQVLWGIDVNDDLQADTFTIAPTAAQLRPVVAARVCMLLRGDKELAGYTNDKVYSLCGQQVNGNAAFNDGFQRRVFEKTVLLRNPIRLSLLN